jgi:hypothetical protein
MAKLSSVLDDIIPLLKNTSWRDYVGSFLKERIFSKAELEKYPHLVGCLSLQQDAVPETRLVGSVVRRLGLEYYTADDPPKTLDELAIALTRYVRDERRAEQARKQLQQIRQKKTQHKKPHQREQKKRVDQVMALYKDRERSERYLASRRESTRASDLSLPDLLNRQKKRIRIHELLEGLGADPARQETHMKSELSHRQILRRQIRDFLKPLYRSKEVLKNKTRQILDSVPSGGRITTEEIWDRITELPIQRS